MTCRQARSRRRKRSAWWHALRLSWRSRTDQSLNSRAHWRSDQAPWRHRDGRSAPAQEPRELARLAVGVPQGRRGLDQPLGAAEREHHRDREGSLERNCLEVIVKPHLDVGPVALVGLVPDGEVEAPDIVLDRVAEKLVQMRAAGPEAHDLAIVIAREHEVVAVAEGEPEARRRDGCADL